MSEYQGVIQKHFPKQWGTKTFYSVSLSGVDGFFSFGLVKPPAEGTSVAFSAKPNAKGFMEVNTKTLEVRADGVPETASVVKAAGKSVAEKGYWERKEERDLRNDSQRELGASRNTAISLIDLMLKHEAIPLPKTQNKREEFLYILMNAYAEKLMGSATPRDMGGSGTAAPVEAKVNENTTKNDEDAEWK